MDESENLLACPFCGGAAPVILTKLTDGAKIVMCQWAKCAARTAAWDTEEKAVEKWNLRAGAPEHGATARSRLGAVSGSAAERKRRAHKTGKCSACEHYHALTTGDKIWAHVINLQQCPGAGKPPNIGDQAAAPEAERGKNQKGK